VGVTDERDERRGGSSELVVAEVQGEDREDDADGDLAASFCFERRPRLRCLEILMKSSRNPMIRARS
jgi:hypothetical protein